jgi:hypothetical protein
MPDLYLVIASVVLFIIAAIPNSLTIRCEWLAAACLAATLL